MPFIDFHALRERVSIDSVASILPVKWERTGEQLRTTCPAHGGTRGLIVTPSKGLFICQASPEAKKGGDCIGLYAHVVGCSNFEAAKRIEKEFGKGAVDSDCTVTVRKDRATAPQKPEGRTAKAQPAPAPFDADAYAAKLTYTDEVAALGISEDDAAQLQVGYSSTGLMRGRVCFPIRNLDGTISGFVGWNGTDLKLPSRWRHGNVMPFKRPA